MEGMNEFWKTGSGKRVEVIGDAEIFISQSCRHAFCWEFYCAIFGFRERFLLTVRIHCINFYHETSHQNYFSHRRMIIGEFSRWVGTSYQTIKNQIINT